MTTRVARALAIWGGIFFAAAAPFAVSLSGGFLNWDDAAYLVENHNFRGFSFPHLSWMFSTMTGGHYMPLTWLSFALNHAAGGMDPFGYRLVNLLLHGANAVLFFQIARRLLRGPSAGPAVLAALFFALHPLRVESVAWITERRDVLSAFFWLLALLWFLRAQEGAGAVRRRDLALCFAAFGLSLLAKAWAVTFPAALLILDVYQGRLPDSPRRWSAFGSLWRERLPFWILAAGFALLAARAQSNAGALHAGNWVLHAKQAACAPLFYLLKILWPAGLVPLYEFPPDFDGPLWTAAAFAGLAASAAALWGWRRAPAAAWLFFIVTLLPVSGLFQSGRQFAADRYTYLAALPWALFFGLLWNARAARPARAAAAAALALLAFQTHTYARAWRGSESLWRRAVTLRPQSGELRASLAGALLQDGQTAAANEAYSEALRLSPNNEVVNLAAGDFWAARDDAKAMEFYRRAAAADPGDARVWERQGQLLSTAGRWGEAVPLFRAAIDRRPAFWEAHCGLGTALWQTGDRDAALLAWREAEKLFPADADIQHNLAIAALSQDRADEAEWRSRWALAMRPNFPEALASRAGALLLLNRPKEARLALAEALRLRPDFPEAREALAGLDQGGITGQAAIERH